MSEDKSTFKVTDRRLFNPDGTARDIEREEPPAITNITENTSPLASTAPTTNVISEPRQETRPANATPAATSQPANDAAQKMGANGDPNAFINLVMFIASPAAAALGLSDHPAMAGREIDLPLAKHCLDLLATLREKTAGKLVPEESETLDGILGELRMQYVSLVNSAPPKSAPPPRGFTGSDITGGK